MHIGHNQMLDHRKRTRTLLPLTHAQPTLHKPYADFNEHLASWLAVYGYKNSRNLPIGIQTTVKTIVAWCKREGYILMAHNFDGLAEPLDALALVGGPLNGMASRYVRGSEKSMNDLVNAAGLSAMMAIGRKEETMVTMARLLHVMGWEFYLEDA